jgi:hypothetical protein
MWKWLWKNNVLQAKVAPVDSVGGAEMVDSKCSHCCAGEKPIPIGPPESVLLSQEKRQMLLANLLEKTLSGEMLWEVRHVPKKWVKDNGGCCMDSECEERFVSHLPNGLPIVLFFEVFSCRSCLNIGGEEENIQTGIWYQSPSNIVGDGVETLYMAVEDKFSPTDEMQVNRTAVLDVALSSIGVDVFPSVSEVGPHES